MADKIEDINSIVRYLAGRFPETTSATDDNGRTALHYASTVHDNGHFYNLLTHLGANPNAEDNFGHATEFYTDHEQSDGILSHKQLLRDYGAEEDLADEMLNDQELNLNNNQVEIPLFRTEEGRYLATSLGDPLIKGLTEVANKRPSDPITFLASYLYSFANQNKLKHSAKPNSDTNNNNIEVITQAKEEVKVSAPTVTKQGSMERSDDMAQSPDGPEIAPSSDDRDEHGQSMLHFACARSHGRNSLIQLIQESGTNISYRDELYRTARDVSLQAAQQENAKEIDRYVLGLAAKGDYDAISNLLMEGYDHIVDVTDNDNASITEIASKRGHKELITLFDGVQEFEENRENLLSAVRAKDLDTVKSITQLPDGAKLAGAKNYYGRCAMHLAVLSEDEEIVEYLATNFKSTLRVGDNLERTALHYAMGVSSVESLSRILIKNGAKRVMKDLKGRQPSYYFMNKADIIRLQEEEKE